MIVSPSTSQGTSLVTIEYAFTVVGIAVSLCLPRLGSSYFSRIERAFGRLARKQGLAVAFVGFAALLLRLAILPLCPIPQPFVQDDFSFLLAADTFASGKLTNPTPAMWTHFESFHITMQPTYMSMYFPAQGLFMAAGKVLAGNPWYGILFATALMCASICWMLQAWLPPTWALLGGILAVLRLGLFSYWINTYTGAGSIAALGGALVLGALPRMMRSARSRDSLLLGVGVVLLATSRPFEGALLCLPVAAALGWWIFRGKNRPPAIVLLRCAIAPLVLIIFAGSWMAYYDYRVNGNPTILPYTLDRATYAAVPYWVWRSPPQEPRYRHKVMRDYYVGVELPVFLKLHTLRGFLAKNVFKPLAAIYFFSGIALLPPLMMLGRVFRDRRTRFFFVCLLVFAAGMLTGTFLLVHYVSPFTAVFYAIGLQSMRHLRVWRPGGQPVGLSLVRLTVTVCFVLALIRHWAQPLHLKMAGWPGTVWTAEWYGPGQFGAARADVEAGLEQLSGGQLVIVRYSADHDPSNDWVYNAADIDGSKVIWAREMDAANNLELIHYYKDRSVWLVQPDTNPAQVSPYRLAR